MILNMINRGIKSIVGHKIKTVILLLLIIILGSVVASAIVMTNGIHNTTTHLRRSIPAIVMSDRDVEALMEAGYTLDEINRGDTASHFRTLTREMIYEIANLPYVRTFDYTTALTPGLRSFDLEKYVPQSINYWDGGESSSTMFELSSVSRPNFVHIEEGVWELVAGRLFTEEEMYVDESREHAPILITESVANLNGLSVDSVLTLYRNAFELPENAVIPEDGFTGISLDNVWEHEYFTFIDLPISFEIVGIIRMPYEPSDDWELFSFQMLNQNSFIIPNWKAEELNRSGLETMRAWTTFFGIEEMNERIAGLESMANLITPIWILYDVVNFESFAKQANEILPEFNIVEDLSFAQHDVLRSLGSVNTLMNQALVFAIGATLIVLTLIILLYLRDRKHEIGVYLALGEKKENIIFQVLFEVLTITILGLIIAIFVGNIVANQMSDFLLREAFVNAQETCDFPTVYSCWEPPRELAFNGFGIERGQMEFEELIEIFDVSLDIRAMVIFFGIALATVIFSIVIPVMYLVELNPKEILLRGNVG